MPDREPWSLEDVKARQAAARAAAIVDLDLPTTNHLAMDAILACEMCDERGYNANGMICDHVDRTEIARRGVQRCREAINRAKARERAAEALRNAGEAL